MEIGALNYRLSLETTSFFSGLRAVYNKINALANTRTDIGVNVHANTTSAMRELQEVYNAGIDLLKVLNTSPNMRFSTNFKEVANDFMKLGADIETALYKALSAQEFEINDDAIETYRKKFAVVNDQIVNMDTGEILDFPVDFDTEALVQYLNDLKTVPEEMDTVVQKATQLKDLLSKPIDVGQQLTLFDITNPEQDIATATNTLIENASEIPEKFERAVSDLKFPELQPDIETQQISSDVSYINQQLDEIPDIVEISAEMDFGQGRNLHSMYDNTRTDTETIDTSAVDLSDTSKIKSETTKVAIDITDALAKIAQVEIALQNLQNAANITLELNDSGVDRALSAAAENVSAFVNSTGTRYIDAYVDLNGTTEAKDKLKEFKDAYEDVSKIKSINLKVSIQAAKNKLEDFRKHLIEITTQDYDPIRVAVMLYDADTLASDLSSIIKSYQEFADNEPIAVPIDLEETEQFFAQIKNTLTDIQADIQNKPLTIKMAENTGLPTYAELVAMLGRLQSWYDANPLKVNFSSEVNGESVQELKDLLNNIQAWYDANPLHFVFGSDEGYSSKTFPNLVAVFQKQLDRNPLHFTFDTTSTGLPTYAELVAMLGRLQSWYDANPLKVNFSSEVNGESVQELKDLLNNIQAWYDANPLRMAFDDSGLDGEYSKLHQIIMDLQPYYDANPLDIRVQIDDSDIVNKVAAINEMLGVAETSDTSITIRTNMDDTDIVNKVAAINEMLASLETISGSIKIVTNLEEFAKSLEKVENDIKELSQKKGTVSILGDIDELKKTIEQVKKLVADVNKLKGTTKIFSDASAATKTFTSIKARIKEISALTASIYIFGDIDDVEEKVNKIKDYVNEINALSGNVKIETDIFEATVNFEQVKKDIAQIKKDVDSLNAFNSAIKISIETDADISAARAELEKIGAAIDLMEEYDATVTVRADVSAAKQAVEELEISLSNLKRDVVSTPITIPVSFEPTWNRTEERKPTYTDKLDLETRQSKADSNVVFNAVLNTEAFDQELDILYQQVDLARKRAVEPIRFNVDAAALRVGSAWLENLQIDFENTQRFLSKNKLQIQAEATLDKDIKNIWTDTEVRQMRENLEAVDKKTYTITIDSNIKEYSAAASRLNTYLGKIPTQIRTSWFLERAYDQTEIDNINKQLDELTADVVIPVKISLSGTDEIKGTADATLQTLPSGKEIAATFNIDTSAVDEAQNKLDKLVGTLNETNTNKTVSVTLDTSNLKLENITVDGSELKITGVKISQVDGVDTSAIQGELNKLRGGVEIPITADNTQAISSIDSVSMALTKLSSGIEIPIFTAADFGNLKAGFESLKTDFKSLNTSCQNLNAKISKLGEDSTIHITADTSEIDSAIGEIASSLVILKENSSLKFSTKDVETTGKQAVDSVGNRAQKKAQEVTKYISERIDALSMQGYEAVESWGSAFAGASWLYVLNKVSDVIGNIVSDSNSFIMDMERSTISFTYLLQDYTKAQAMIRELQDFAIKSPLNFSGATRGVQQLMVMGFSAIDSLEMLETITDAAAVSGRDMNDSIQRIALALGQIKQTGVLRAQEANQLIDVNIPVYELLQEQLDISLTSSDLGEAKIESEKAIDAILTGLKEKYGGASEAMQMTIEGSISAITDAFSILYQQLSSPIAAHIRGLLQDINEAIQGITEALQNLSFEDFMKKIFPESVIENATEIIYNFQMSFVVLRKYLEGFVKWMSNSFNAFSSVFSTLSNAFNNFFVAVYAAFSKWYQFSETFRNISHILGVVAVLAAAAAAAKLFLKILSPLTSVLFLIPKAIAAVVTSLLSMNLAMAASNIAVVALLALLGYLIYRAGLFKNIWNSLTGIFDQGKISADDYSDAIKDLGEQLNDANKDVSDLAETVDDNFNQSFDEVFLIDPSDASSIDAIAGTLGTLGDVLTGVNNISGLKIDLSEAFDIDTLKDAWDEAVNELKKYIGDFSYDDVARAISAALGTVILTGNPFLALITGLVGMFWEELAEQLGIDPENGDKIIGAAIGLGVTKVIGKLANWKWNDYIKWGPGIAGISAGVFPAITEALDQLDKKGYVYAWGAVIGEVDFSLVFSGVSWMVNGQKVTDAGAAFDKLAEKLGGLDKISTDSINTTVGKQLKALGIDEVSKGVYQLASVVSVAADLVFAWQLGNVVNELVELDIAGALWEALPLATGYAIAYAGGAPALAVPIAAIMTLSFMGVEAAWNAGGTMLGAINEATEALSKGAAGAQRDITNAKYGTDWTALLINSLESVNTYSNLKATLSGIEKQYEAATGNSFDEFFENIVGIDKDTYGTLLMNFKHWQETGSNTYKKAVSRDLSGLTSAGLDIFALSVSDGSYNRTDLTEKQEQNAKTYQSLTSILKENTGYYQTFNQLIPIQQTELQSVIDSLNNTQTLSADQILLLMRFTDEDWQTLQENLKTDEAVEALQKITNSLGQYGTAYKAAIDEIQSTSETLDSVEASEAVNAYRTKVNGVYKALGDNDAIDDLNNYIESLTLPEIDWDKIYKYFEAVGAPQELLDAIILVRDNYDKFGDAAENAKKAAVEQTERAAEVAGDLAPDIQEQINKVKNFLTEIDWTAWEEYLRSIGMDEEQIRALINPMKSAAETLQNGLTDVENTASKHISDAATAVLDNTTQRCQEWSDKLSTLKDKIQTNTGEILKKFSSLLSSENKDFNFLNLGDFQLNLQLSKTKGSNTNLNTLRVQSAYATGGIIDREQVALVGEGNKREAVIPLENRSAMAPFAEAVANGVSSVLGPMISSISSGGTTSQQLQPVYVGTLIADDRGLRELQRKMNVIQLKESRRS